MCRVCRPSPFWSLCKSHIHLGRCHRHRIMLVFFVYCLWDSCCLPVILTKRPFKLWRWLPPTTMRCVNVNTLVYNTGVGRNLEGVKNPLCSSKVPWTTLARSNGHGPLFTEFQSAFLVFDFRALFSDSDSEDCRGFCLRGTRRRPYRAGMSLFYYVYRQQNTNDFTDVGNVVRARWVPEQVPGWSAWN